MTDRLLETAFSTPAMTAATSDEAWLQGMLDFEAALSTAQADQGLMPVDAAQAIAAACRVEHFDIAAIATAVPQGGNPAIPLVKALNRQVPDQAARHVHWGATSQDVIDTGTMRVLRRALPLIVTDLEGLETACRRHAEQHRDTPMAGRTLLQQGPPVTFGLKAAGWLDATHRVRRELARRLADDLVVQLGGAVGTLAPLGDHGAALLPSVADKLGLNVPNMPWHTARDRMIGIGASLAMVGSAMGKVANDVIMLMQTEVGEVSDAHAGGSSAMPHKHNPVDATLAQAAARRIHGQVGILFSASIHEHERAVGAWHAEWQPLFDALRLTAAAVHHVRRTVEGLGVNAEQMQRNLARTQGVTMAEAVKSLLAPALGREQAHKLITGCCNQAIVEQRPLVDVLNEHDQVARHLDAATIRAALNPNGYTGSAGHFVDQVLARTQD